MRLTPDYFTNLKRKRRGDMLPIGKTLLYYETYGKGKPFFLFHGGLSCIDGLRHQIAFFAKYFKVIVPERPGHGHTADIRGPYTYEAFAGQTARFMDALKIKKALMLGTSDGANLIFYLAAKRPDLVSRFIAVGGNFHYSGCDAEFQKHLKKQRPKTDSRYAAYSPDGKKHYTEVFNKCRTLWLTQPKWKESLLRAIKAPGLIVAGDRDMITHEHTLELFRCLRRAELAIIPGTTHSVLKEKPRLVNQIILEFLRQKR